MTTHKFVTDTGEVFKSATQREFIVVVADTGEIIRRTDDVRIARKVAANSFSANHRVVARRLDKAPARPSRNDPDFLVETHRCDRPQDLLPGQGSWV